MLVDIYCRLLVKVMILFKDWDEGIKCEFMGGCCDKLGILKYIRSIGLNLGIVLC